MNSFRAVIAVRLNASQRSRVGVGMNRSTRGQIVKCFVRSNGLDTTLYINIPLSSFSFFMMSFFRVSREILSRSACTDVKVKTCVLLYRAVPSPFACSLHPLADAFNPPTTRDFFGKHHCHPATHQLPQKKFFTRMFPPLSNL